MSAQDPQGTVDHPAAISAQNRWTTHAPTTIVGAMHQEEIWDIDAAQHYDTPGSGMFAPEVS
ncbi:hypothetical protein [Nonomuraea basaltis]|uniref:hypothetical protein n=1 Tax=Nonomuraea basaltis TaxID=2495887 RepID=UPI00110C44FA|nr:hypothetical protein [Nonomuraea basaltis]TMR95432.1 hypothetical protein EJK15_28380 [Nonomuraea basaltis]